MQAKYFWLLDYIKASILIVEKIRGAVNSVNAMTRHLNGALINYMYGSFALKYNTRQINLEPKWKSTVATMLGFL